MLVGWTWYTLALSGIIVWTWGTWLACQCVRIKDSIGRTWHTCSLSFIEVSIACTCLTLLSGRVKHHPIRTSLALVSLSIVEVASRCIALFACFTSPIILIAGWTWHTLTVDSIEVVARWAVLAFLGCCVQEHLIGAIHTFLQCPIVILLGWACLTQRCCQIQIRQPTTVETGTSAQVEYCLSGMTSLASIHIYIRKWVAKWACWYIIFCSELEHLQTIVLLWSSAVVPIGSIQIVLV